MKKILTAMVLALGAMFGAFEADAALAGSGTKADPYRIGSYDGLVAFAAKVNGGETNACAVLTADITATGTTWTPIGDDWGKTYVGTFDGQNHTISDLSNASVSPSPDCVGLFAFVGLNGIVRNVNLVNVNFAGSERGACAGVAGLNLGGTVKNCSVSGVVKEGCYSGGIVGYNISGMVEGCCNTGKVIGYYVGGIVGINYGGVVKDCYNAGAVEATDPDDGVVGGVVGGNGGGMAGTIENCYNIGSVAGVYVGGVACINDSDSKLLHCYSLDSVAGGATIYRNEGGTEVVDVRTLSAAEFKNQASFTGWDFKKVWKMGENAPKLRTGYDVTYDENWAGGAKTKKELDAGDGILANAPADPKREGWYFCGWFTEREGGSKVTGETVADGDATYYAQWGKPVATFAAGAVSSSESKTVKLTVFGGSLTGPSSVKVFMTYQTAAAADLDLANATINGVKVKGGLKFPLTLAWDTADVTPYVIEIPLKGDKQVEDDETLTFQLADAVGTEMGETDVCTVTVEDPAFDELRGRIETGTATKAESNNWIKVSHDGIPYFCGLADPADGGKATGSGYCPANKKVTLKASASKGFAFAGWTTNEERSASAPYPEGYFVATTPSLVIDRTAKPAANSKTSTTISNLTESTTFYAVFEGDPRVTATSVEFTEDGGVVASEGGKVTGAGRYAPGKKVTLKATAAKGFVFGGWYSVGNGECGTGNGDEDGLISQAASFSFEMGEEDVDLYARFVTADADAGSIAATFNGAAMPSPTDGSPAMTTNVWAGVYLEWPLTSEALSQTTVKVSGLPSGLKFTAKDVVDSKTKQVTVPANTIYGAPTAASKTDKNGKPTPSKVKVTVTTAGKSSATYEIALTVDPLPNWAVGSFDGAVGAQPNGTVALTVAANGKISGKILEGGRTWSLSAAWFDEAVSPKSEVGSPVFYATVIAKSGKLLATNEIAVASVDGVGVLTGTFELSNSQTFELSSYQNLWKRADTKAAQPVFKNNIVVEYYPLGVSGDKNNTVKFTFKKDGAVSFSGKIGGVSVSGSAQIVWDGKGWKMTVYAPPKPTAKPPFEGWCETFPVRLTLEENIVTAVELGGEEPEMVQLWEGGPLWATRNIGAKKPEDSGYYFWWGDTVGYTRSGGTWTADYYYSGVTWVSSTGAEMSTSPFLSSSCPTYNKDNSELLSAGYIDSTGNLTAAHDAAQVHLGGSWRMPTHQEQQDLIDKCDWIWTTQNNVNGYIVRGRGDYDTNSIFLPCAGYGYGTSLRYSGSYGYYWSSVPRSDYYYDAYGLFFDSGYLDAYYYHSRDCGLSVRPVQSPAE